MCTRAARKQPGRDNAARGAGLLAEDSAVVGLSGSFVTNCVQKQVGDLPTAADYIDNTVAAAEGLDLRPQVVDLCPCVHADKGFAAAGIQKMAVDELQVPNAPAEGEEAQPVLADQARHVHVLEGERAEVAAPITRCGVVEKVRRGPADGKVVNEEHPSLSRATDVLKRVVIYQRVLAHDPNAHGRVLEYHVADIAVRSRTVGRPWVYPRIGFVAASGELCGGRHPNVTAYCADNIVLSVTAHPHHPQIRVRTAELHAVEVAVRGLPRLVDERAHHAHRVEVVHKAAKRASVAKPRIDQHHVFYTCQAQDNVPAVGAVMNLLEGPVGEAVAIHPQVY